LFPMVDGCLRHVGDDEVLLVQVGAAALRNRRPTSNAQSLFIRIWKDTCHCLKRGPDRARMLSDHLGLHLRWTKSFEDFLKCSTQLALRLDLIRGFTPLIRKLDRIGVSPGANPDLHRGYHARA
jgi:hypothetical protein